MTITRYTLLKALAQCAAALPWVQSVRLTTAGRLYVYVNRSNRVFSIVITEEKE